MNKINNQKEFEIQSLSVEIEKAANSLHNTLKYIYSVAVNDFYNINVKDLFKISLSDISEPSVLKKLGVSPDTSDVWNSEQFDKLSDLFFFAFAVRAPYLMRNQKVKEAVPKIKARFYRELFELCVEKGAIDHGGIVRETFKANLKGAKSTGAEPSFNGEWFRRWVYANSTDFSAITNKNMFLLGCIDALLPLYYAKLTENLVGLISKE
jgi:hypothetical protein